MDRLPGWADAVLVPLVSLLLAALLSALVILGIGESPVEALRIMITGAFGSTYGWGYTLYYATTFMFTGLAFAVASHAGMFNIGAEGQAMLGGLGVALVCLALPWPHWALALPAAMAGGAVFGALWALVPAWLQATRGSHIVITTIMFNLIAAALLNYLLGGVLRPAGSVDSATARFPEGATLPTLHDMLAPLGISFSKAAPVNISLFVAVLACLIVWLLIWRTRLGYEIRALGYSQTASRYAGIGPVKIVVVAMLISGGLAGLMAVNVVMGEAERLLLNPTEGAGFIGIAVALMGRNHPLGVFLAAILFGFLYQGGGELGLWTSIPRELIVVIQALVILFTGALDNMVRMPMERAYGALRRRRKA
ncbi:Branched-chain amino acid transport system / permease component [Roseovarius sp. THAF27]|uniref:ABC transporter permease n=1 Tax=unclassified Roseovarius TaxID=2614913 RepID=UPI00126984E2|nr:MULTISPECIES: ABC transporter permease [unclassified Roseovarius]QFT79407.1 Branched-chain amino acid transport system / permease component [Roseovarius sp. THAF27]QFT97407.1 Branched-chain amino acid transport system / permease component [Roseovarius sp. THAF8]